MLQVGGTLCAIAVVFLAVLALMGSFVGIPKPQDIIMCIYQIGFGLMMVGGEWKLKSVMKWFRFLSTYFGLGFFYIFVGVFSINVGRWYQWLVGAIVAFVGVCYALMGKFGFDRGVDLDKIEADQRERVMIYQPAGQTSDQVLETPSVPPPTVNAAAAAQRHIAESAFENHNPFETQDFGRPAYDV